jgi:uncharacterized DUF497 family protein
VEGCLRSEHPQFPLLIFSKKFDIYFRTGSNEILRLTSMYNCAYNAQVEFEWDIKKALSNLKKHRIDFADVIPALEDERAVTIPDDHPDEGRFVTIGMDALGRILVVVYTWRKNRIRIISARKATATEINQYKGKIT